MYDAEVCRSSESSEFVSQSVSRSVSRCGLVASVFSCVNCVSYVDCVSETDRAQISGGAGVEEHQRI